MSKRGYISRYLLIIKKLKAKPYASFEELQGYIENQFEYMQMEDDSLFIGFSKRTLQRDIKEIRNNFGVDIEYSTQNKGYFISESERENMNFQRMIEAFDVFNSLNLAQEATPFIFLEKRRPQGTENLFGLIHAIKNKLKINFSYQKYWDDEMSERITDPYALKEFKNRWYVIAKDNKDDKIKSFALDRLTNLEISSRKFNRPNDYSVDDNYRYAFGIISPGKTLPQSIILSFDSLQGKYIKSLPLHESQMVLIDSEEELRISLKLHLTHDFVMELLSYGENLKVLAPKELIDEIISTLQLSLTQYQSG